MLPFHRASTGTLPTESSSNLHACETRGLHDNCPFKQVRWSSNIASALLAAIDDRDVDTSADSAGEVKGSAFVPSTGVGLHTPDGTDGAKDADADSGSGEKPQHVDKANTAEQSQAEREISAPSQGKPCKCVIHVLYNAYVFYCLAAILSCCITQTSWP